MRRGGARVSSQPTEEAISPPGYTGLSYIRAATRRDILKRSNDCRTQDWDLILVSQKDKEGQVTGSTQEKRDKRLSWLHDDKTQLLHGFNTTLST